MLSYGQVFGDDKELHVPMTRETREAQLSPQAHDADHHAHGSATSSPVAPVAQKGASVPGSPGSPGLDDVLKFPGKATKGAENPADKSAASSEIDLKAAAQSIAGSKYLTPVITVIAGIVMVTMILVGAGQVTQSSPKRKAIIFVVDGVKGTVFEEIGFNGLWSPNIKAAGATDGVHAACLSRSDRRCAKTQSGVALGAPFTYQSAPGIASILTGVDANVHKVYNTSFNSILQFSQTALDNPTFLATAVTNGYRTSAIGGNAFLTTVGSDSTCSNYGVLDFECGAAALSRCMRSTSCNLVDRVPLITRSDLPDRQAESDTLSETIRLLAAGTDLLVVHINRPNIAATDTTRNGSFTSASRIYDAQIYYADALIGQALALIKKRAASLSEKWLVLGTSDHGGHGSTFGDTPGDDNLVPFWGAIYGTNGAVKPAALTTPVTQMDVAPTVLEWFNLLTPALSARMTGRVQMLCGVFSGSNCTARGFN